jgi:hypothetical protein
MTEDVRAFWLGFAAGVIVTVEGFAFALWGLYT